MVHPPAIFSLKCLAGQLSSQTLRCRKIGAAATGSPPNPGQYLAFGDPDNGLVPPSTHKVSAKLAATVVSGTSSSRLIGTILNSKTAN
jgi:hypothetical protein